MSGDEVIEAFGVRWSLGTDGLDPHAQEHLHELWRRCRVPGAGAGDDGVLPFPVTTGSPYAVSRALTLASLRRRRGSAVLLHAVGLSEGDRAVALVGPSGAGKSTAAVVLGRHFGYLTDETVAVEPDDRVAPYPKPVSVVTDPAAPWDKGESGPDELGLREATGPAYLRAVVLLDRGAAHEVPRLDRLPLVDALPALIAQSSSLPLVARPLHRLATLASGAGGPWVLRYREVGDCVELVRGLLEGDVPEPRERERWTSTPGTPLPALTASGPLTPVPSSPAPLSGTGTRLVRAPWVDAVHAEAGSVVLVGEEVVRLGPVGEAVWRAAGEPVTADGAREAVVAALGSHPDAGAVVAAGIEALLGSGVLRRVP